MTYTITIESNSNIAKNLIQYIKTFDFVTVREEPTKKAPTKVKTKAGTKKAAFPQEVLEAAEKLKWTTVDIVEAAKREKMSPEDYAFTLLLSKKINHNIAKRVCEDFDIPYKKK